MAMIQELLDDCFHEDVHAADLLKRDKAVAKQHGLQEFEKWTILELEGYDKSNPYQLSEYRRLRGGECPEYASMADIELELFDTLSIHIRCGACGWIRGN